tara:strand:- start:34499 stop:34843 length:345 start_codon:yes stop_codon:yes gene_type:complete
MLKYCASLGDHVLVGIDSDDRVRAMKDPARPINDQETRKFILLNFKWVNDVIIFNNDDELTSLVAEYHPDYMIVGSDWKDKKVIGSEHAKIVGFFDRIDAHSTTKIIESITNRR